jgi:hypothetical protein
VGVWVAGGEKSKPLPLDLTGREEATLPRPNPDNYYWTPNI